MSWPMADWPGPSGRMSKRARKALDKRMRERLFGGLDIRPKLPPQPTKRERLLRRAQELRELVARGMHPRAYPKLAARLEAEAAELEA